MIITSLQNPSIKRLVALRGRRERLAEGAMLVEGHEELELALESSAKPREVYICPELMAAPKQAELASQLVDQGVTVTELSRPVFEKAAYREGPDGWLAVFAAPKTDLAALKPDKSALFLICEAVEKPGNLGAMLRTADAVGANGVIAPAAITDWGNPNVVRASKGTIFTVPVAEATPDELVDWLHKHQIKLLAATPEATASMYEVDLSGPVAIAVGSEKYGLSKELMAAADLKVLIPMQGKVNSLNVSTSAALLLYEAHRQRNR